MYDIEEIRRRFAEDHFATNAAGARIDSVDDGYARCSLTLGDIHRNAAGGVMGGVAFTLADFAFAVASNADNTQTVSLCAQITYTSPARGGELIAEARRQKEGRSTCFYVVSITDELGTQVATVTVTGFIKRNTEK